MRNRVWATGNAKRALVVLAIAMVLAGCENFPVPTAPGAAAPTSTPAAERDIVRTDLFQVQETALWDGRPTFGGVWVAYAGDVQPERVRIENLSNGKSVIGALFRRERELPGPRIQLSADAAAALNVVAGTPVDLRVTALRRENVAPEAPVDAVPAVAAPVPAPVTPSPVTPSTVTPPPVTAPEPEIVEHVIETPAAAPPSGAPARPYAQVGTFATESNAQDLVTILASNGVQAAVRAVTVDGRALFRVVAGPADSAASLAALIAKLKSLGYSDAFPIR